MNGEFVCHEKKDKKLAAVAQASEQRHNLDSKKYM